MSFKLALYKFVHLHLNLSLSDVQHILLVLFHQEKGDRFLKR
ncbi:hypothetical protein [Coleofasciculus sp. FACHB-129]|nr:hypothetical protein [Coleofasciculus sp. FACHB-129]